MRRALSGMRLLLVSTLPIEQDPRARRAARAAAASRWSVSTLSRGSRGSSRLHVRRRRAPRSEAPTGVARFLREARGVFRILRLVVRTTQLTVAGRRLPRPDVVHAHDLVNLPTGWLLARGWRSSLVYDAHELYTAFEPDPPRIAQALEAWLEGALARRAAAVVTVSEGIARELERRHRLRRRPIVVLNCPNAVELDDVDGAPPHDVHAIYQSAVGPARILDDVLDAAHRARGVRVTLRVLGADAAELAREVERRGLAAAVSVEPPVASGDLVRALRGFHVGLVIDRPVTLNTELALPNKLFEYLMAGLAVVVPQLPELAALVESERVGLTYEAGRPDSLAEALSRLAADRELLAELRVRARAVALDRYNAEVQTQSLLEAWAT